VNNIGSTDGQRIYTPDPLLVGNAGHHMQLFALTLGEPEFRRRINRPDMMRQIVDFHRVLSDPQVILAFDDPTFRPQLNNPEFGRTFDDPEVNRIMAIPQFRRRLEEIICEVLDDDAFLYVLSLPDLRRLYLIDWAQRINNAPLTLRDILGHDFLNHLMNSNV
jgi:hypothetical protein